MSTNKRITLRLDKDVYDTFLKRHNHDIAMGRKPKSSLNSAIELELRKSNNTKAQKDQTMANQTQGICPECGKATKDCYPNDGRFVICKCEGKEND